MSLFTKIFVKLLYSQVKEEESTYADIIKLLESEFNDRKHSPQFSTSHPIDSSTELFSI